MTYVLKNIKIIDDTVFIRRNLRGYTTHLQYAAVFRDFASAHAYKKEMKLVSFEPCVTVMDSNIHRAYGGFCAEQKELEQFSC